MAGYSDDATFTTWLTDNGYTLPSGAPSEAVLRQRGSVYVDATYGPRFRGTPTDGVTQERAWPRTGASVYGATVPDTDVPLAVIHASFMAAWAEANDEGVLEAIASGAQTIKRERVDVIETEYQDANRTAENMPYDPLAPSAITPILSRIDGLLKPYLVLADYGLGIWSIGPTSDC